MPEIQETSTSEQLRALIRLQHIDSRMDQIAQLQGDLPDEIRDLEDEKAGLKTRIDKFKQEQQETEVLRRKASRDTLDSEALIKRYEEQQLQVRNNREYDALTKEIEAQRQRIVDAAALNEEIDAREKENAGLMEQAEERFKELDDVLSAKRKELQAVMEDTQHELDVLAKRRTEAQEAVDARYVRAYTRLRDRMRDGRAVVPIERGAAGGFAVPPQRQVEVRQRNRIVVCEHTGRIVVDDELYRDTLKEMQL